MATVYVRLVRRTTELLLVVQIAGCLVFQCHSSTLNVKPVQHEFIDLPHMLYFTFHLFYIISFLRS